MNVNITAEVSYWSNKYLKSQRWKNLRIALIRQCFSTMQQTEIQTHGVALLIIELPPLCHKEQQLKIKIGKAVEYGGSAKGNTYVRAICKLEQISHMAMAIVSCCGWEEIFKVITLSKLDIWIDSVRHNWEATLVQHFSASSAYSALSCHGWPGTCGSCASGWEILHSAFLPSGQNFLQPVQQPVVSAA